MPHPEELGEKWPAIYLHARCFECGRIVFSEGYRPLTREDWDHRTKFWRVLLDRHRAECPGANLEQHRTLAALVRMMVEAGRLPEDVAAHLTPILNGLPR